MTKRRYPEQRRLYALVACHQRSLILTNNVSTCAATLVFAQYNLPCRNV